jgi:hypothetical protein
MNGRVCVSTGFEYRGEMIHIPALGPVVIWPSWLKGAAAYFADKGEAMAFVGCALCADQHRRVGGDGMTVITMRQINNKYTSEQRSEAGRKGKQTKAEKDARLLERIEEIAERAAAKGPGYDPVNDYRFDRGWRGRKLC